MKPVNSNPSETLSPQAIAEAAVVDAMKAKQAKRAETEGRSIPERGATPVYPTPDDINEALQNETIQNKLQSIWVNAPGDPNSLKYCWESTLAILGPSIDELVREGTSAYQMVEDLSQENAVLKDDLAGKESEIKRLQVETAEGRTTVANLLRAVETSKAEVQDSSRTAIALAELRAEMNIMGSKKNEAAMEAEEYKRKCFLYENELRHCKGKLARVVQEKVKMERDHRATVALSKNLDSHASSDVDYYKRKASEQTGHIHNLNAVVAEKNRQIEELRRQIERSMSQNRLTNANRKRRSV